MFNCDAINRPSKEGASKPVVVIKNGRYTFLSPVTSKLDKLPSKTPFSGYEVMCLGRALSENKGHCRLIRPGCEVEDDEY